MLTRRTRASPWARQMRTRPRVSPARSSSARHRRAAPRIVERAEIDLRVGTDRGSRLDERDAVAVSTTTGTAVPRRSAKRSGTSCAISPIHQRHATPSFWRHAGTGRISENSCATAISARTWGWKPQRREPRPRRACSRAAARWIRRHARKTTGRRGAERISATASRAKYVAVVEERLGAHVGDRRGARGERRALRKRRHRLAGRERGGAPRDEIVDDLRRHAGNREQHVARGIGRVHTRSAARTP